MVRITTDGLERVSRISGEIICDCGNDFLWQLEWNPDIGAFESKVVMCTECGAQYRIGWFGAMAARLAEMKQVKPGLFELSDSKEEVNKNGGS